MAKERNVEAFDEDAKRSGYVYTDMARLSCRLANQRITDAILGMADIEGRRVIDIGCGDGAYTKTLLDRKPAFLLGVDAAPSAIKRAKSNVIGPNVEFLAQDIYKLYAATLPGAPFDVAVVRGVLHHLYDPSRAVSAILSVASEVIVLEPNGYNPVLKVIEKFSAYHREHEERSYSPRLLRRWFQDNGAKIEQDSYIGLVPMFCPDTMARLLKTVEPLVENIPLLRNIACGQYLMRALAGTNKFSR